MTTTIIWIGLTTLIVLVYIFHAKDDFGDEDIRDLGKKLKNKNNKV